MLFAALEALDMSVDVDGTAVTAITAHFESKLISYTRQRELVSDSQFAPNDEDERYCCAAYALYRRTGAALTIRDRLNTLLAVNSGEPDPAQGLGPEQAVVFCDDLNDQLDAAIHLSPRHSAAGSPAQGRCGFARPFQGGLGVPCRRLPRIAALHHRQQGQRTERLPDLGDITLMAESIQQIHQDHIADRHWLLPE
ncbi:hypothetical protein KBZ18_14585 [Synechococcus sp. Cruz-9H2]|nr:hypothetical protein [Synechococcus sp. Cruz-9H2]